jgi:hypothetical protein
MKEILAEKLIEIIKIYQKNREELTDEKMDLFFNDENKIDLFENKTKFKNLNPELKKIYNIKQENILNEIKKSGIEERNLVVKKHGNLS